MSIWSDIFDQIKLIADASNANITGVATDLPSTPEGQAAIQTGGFFGFVEGFLTALTDPAMWVSLAWLGLGVTLIFTGARLWLGKPAMPSGPPGLSGGLPPVIPV